MALFEMTSSLGGAVSQDLATVQAPRAAIDLHWASSSVFDVIGSWAGESDNRAVAISMATTSRHLSWRVADLRELIPEPDGDDADEPSIQLHPRVAAALDAIRAIPGTAERLGITHRVLLPRLAIECVVMERGTKADEDPDPVVVIAGALLGDLRRDRDDGEVLLAKMIIDVATVQKVGERVVEAERRLVEAGGLVPVSVA